MERMRVPVLLSGIALAGCGGGGGREDIGLGAPSYEEFKQTLQWEPEHGAYLLERDILLSSEEEVYREYERWLARQSGLVIEQTTNDVDVKWNRTQRWNLTYCVSPAFSTAQYPNDYASVVAAMRKAASYWEDAIDVRFVHLSAEDANCTSSNNNVLFNVKSDPSRDGFNAFFPSANRAGRQLLLDWRAGWQGNVSNTGALTHELGHILGFRHEQVQRPIGLEPPEGDPGGGGGYPPGCNREDDPILGGDTTWRSLTPYDSASVMHPPWVCNGTNTGDLVVTQRDAEGAMEIYESPGTVAVAQGETPYARKRSTGDLYRRESSGAWTKIGGPGSQFVFVGSTLYGLGPSGASIARYTSGTSWAGLPGGAFGQILRCVNSLCGTREDGIYRYSGGSSGTWTKIGGPGRMFASTTSRLYGLSPDSTLIAEYTGSGTAWTTYFSGASTKSIAAGSTTLYSISNGARVRKHKGAGSTNFDDIGAAPRQLLPVGAEVYALSLDGQAVSQYPGSGTLWLKIGGPAARLYGQGDSLYATDPASEGIYRFTGGISWTYAGKP
jgi:hypothetical protein